MGKVAQITYLDCWFRLSHVKFLFLRWLDIKISVELIISMIDYVLPSLTFSVDKEKDLRFLL